MREITKTTACTRSEDLVAYLYGEQSETESHDFQEHLRHCASCSAEASSFTEVRESILVWRQQSLGQIAYASPVTNETPAPHVGAQRTRSAMAALREFFALAPFWLRGATAFAGLLLCALAVVAVLHFYEREAAPTLAGKEVPAPPSAAVQTADAKIEPPANNVRPEETVAVQPVVEVPTTAPAIKVNRKNIVRRNTATMKNELANMQKKPAAQSPVLSNQERQQLAKDLQLIAANEDEEQVPRLYDLLNESY